MCLQYFTKVIVVPRSLALRCSSSAREYKSGVTPLQAGGMVSTDNYDDTDAYVRGPSPATSHGPPTAAARADDLQGADTSTTPYKSETVNIDAIRSNEMLPNPPGFADFFL